MASMHAEVIRRLDTLSRLRLELEMYDIRGDRMLAASTLASIETNAEKLAALAEVYRTDLEEVLRP